MKNYDIRTYRYGPDPEVFFKDAFDKISSELSSGEEATVTVNPEKFSEPVQSMASLAGRSGLSVVAVRDITPDEAEIEVKKVT